MYHERACCTVASAYYLVFGTYFLEFDSIPQMGRDATNENETLSSLARIGFLARSFPNQATPKYLAVSSLFSGPRSSALAKFPESQLRWKSFSDIRGGNRQTSRKWAAPMRQSPGSPTRGTSEKAGGGKGEGWRKTKVPCNFVSSPSPPPDTDLESLPPLSYLE
jgi:hypothetical protein